MKFNVPKFKLPKLEFPKLKFGKKKLNEKEQLNTENLDYHKLTFEELSQRYEVSLRSGLDSKQAEKLLVKNGKNLIKQKKPSVVLKLLNYLLTGFCGVLWIGALICFLAWKPIGDPPDPTNLGLAILLIVVILLQAAFSAFQDWSSSKVMKSIKNMMPSSATVIRGGTQQDIPASDLVVGDLVVLAYGTKVPADIRLIESSDLRFDKSMLTGESEAVDGTVECTDERYVESKNIAFMTTLITNGQGKGIVIETGDKTIMGTIAKLTSNAKQQKTSLQREITRFVTFIVVVAVTTVVILLIVWGTWLKVKYPSYITTPTMMVNVIGILVAFIPTGLPVAVTLSLLLMARKMANLRVLVKNLTTIETLSCVNVIASDKTGTLTQNKMFVASVATGSEIVDMRNRENIEKTNALKHLVAMSKLCNNANFFEEDSNNNTPINQRRAKGDATDIALLRFHTENTEFTNVDAHYSKIIEIPFNSKNKWMMKLVEPKEMRAHNEIFGHDFEENNQSFMLLKGAPDILLRKCDSIMSQDGSRKHLNNEAKLDIVKLQNDWCILGQRVLLLCSKVIGQKETSELRVKSAGDVEKYINSSEDFCLVGIVGIIDPPREGMADVVMKCRGAGIRVFMVTGDYALTAAAIATEIGIFTNSEYDTVTSMKDKIKQKKLLNEADRNNSETIRGLSSLLITGSEIDGLEDEDWRCITKYDEIVLARTTPEQKLTTVKEFRKDGYVVAVTGDGVNDAPALKSADIGIAMGGGSEVAMEAAQMVLLDNSFTSILVAIENGRLVFENLRKVILYLLPAGSFAELVPILVNIFLGVPLPLSAFLMICICILTDMFPALSIMLEKPESNLLNRPPRKKTDHLVDGKLLIQAYLFLGVMEAFFSHCCFFWYLDWHGGFSPSDILLGFDVWSSSYKGYSLEEINNFVYTGQTVMFVSIVVMQSFGNIFATRTNRMSLLQRPPIFKQSRNLWLFGAQFVSVALMILIVFVPVCNDLFNTRRPPVEFFFIPLFFALVILAADELRKLFVRNKILCFAKLAW